MNAVPNDVFAVCISYAEFPNKEPMTTAREYAMSALKARGVDFDSEVGNGSLVQLLAGVHGIPFGRRPRKLRAREILEKYMDQGTSALSEAAPKGSPRNVYVIELDPGVLKDGKFSKANPDYIEGKSCLYVGSTCRTPEERFRQHKEGFKACRYPKKFGVALRPDLFEQYNPMGHQEANDREAGLAKDLRKQGYAVWQN